MHDDEHATPTPNTPPPAFDAPATTNGHHITDRSGEHLGLPGRHDPDAERAVAAAILTGGNTILDAVAATGLEPHHALDPTSRAIIAAAYQLHHDSTTIDPITVADTLGDAVHALETPAPDGTTIHGKAVLVALYPAAAYTAAAHHARIVVDHARTRELKYAATELVEAVGAHYDTGITDETRLDRALQHIIDLRSRPAAGARSSWHAVDLAPILDGGSPSQPPTLLRRTDGQSLVYAGKVNAFNAESETGKSWLALWGCAQEIDEGRHAIYIDFEDAAHTAVERLLSFNLDREQIAEHFHYLRPDDPFDIASQAAVEKLITDTTATIVVIDGVTEAMHLHGLSLLDNDDIARFYSLLPRRIASHGPGVIDIDHVPKDVNNRKGGIGGQHKRAGVDGSILLLEPSKPFGRGRHGVARIIVDKDRPGHVRAIAHEGKIAGELHLDSSNSAGQPNLYVQAVDVGQNQLDGTPWDGPTQCMEAILHWFDANPGEEVAQRSFPERLRAAGVSYRNQTIRDALERLVVDGHLQARNGPRNARLYQLATPTDGEPNGMF